MHVYVSLTADNGNRHSTCFEWTFCLNSTLTVNQKWWDRIQQQQKQVWITHAMCSHSADSSSNNFMIVIFLTVNIIIFNCELGTRMRSPYRHRIRSLWAWFTCAKELPVKHMWRKSSLACVGYRIRFVFLTIDLAICSFHRKQTFIQLFWLCL